MSLKLHYKIILIMDTDIEEYELHARSYEDEFEREFADEMEMAESMEPSSKTASRSSDSTYDWYIRSLAPAPNVFYWNVRSKTWADARLDSTHCTSCRVAVEMVHYVALNFFAVGYIRL